MEQRCWPALVLHAPAISLGSPGVQEFLRDRQRLGSLESEVFSAGSAPIDPRQETLRHRAFAGTRDQCVDRETPTSHFMCGRGNSDPPTTGLLYSNLQMPMHEMSGWPVCVDSLPHLPVSRNDLVQTSKRRTRRHGTRNPEHLQCC